MPFFSRKELVVSEPDRIADTISRLESLTERIQATAAILEHLVAKLREEEGIPS